MADVKTTAAPAKPAATPAAPVKALRKPRAKTPENESKADKFRRLAGARMGKALTMISNIGNCSNRSQYDYTPEQVAKMKADLINMVNNTMARYETAPKAEKGAATYVL